MPWGVFLAGLAIGFALGNDKARELIFGLATGKKKVKLVPSEKKVKP